MVRTRSGKDTALTAYITHKQVTVNAPFYETPTYICVDEGLVTTLKMIWEQGYVTNLSCENNFGDIWISFPIHCFKKLVRVAHDDYFKSLHDGRSLNPYKTCLYNFLEEETHTKFGWDDMGYVTEDDYWMEGEELEFTVCLRFECSLLDTFCELFKELHKGREPTHPTWSSTKTN